jgi:hypothetical protein
MAVDGRYRADSQSKFIITEAYRTTSEIMLGVISLITRFPHGWIMMNNDYWTVEIDCVLTLLDKIIVIASVLMHTPLLASARCILYNHCP